MRARQKRAFTLIEVMVAVAIIGILSVLAIPALVAYVARSKTAEASQNLNQLFKLAAVYYSREVTGQGAGSPVSGACTVGSADPLPATPQKEKQALVVDQAQDPELYALRFTVADLVYYSYGFTSLGGACGRTADLDLYTFFANGNLDGDATLSTFELAAGSNGSNEFYHARGMYIANETD